MSDAQVLIASTPFTPRARQRRGLGIAAFVLPVIALLVYESVVVVLDLVVLTLPGTLLVLIELTEATGVPFILPFAVFGLHGGVVGLALVALTVSVVVLVTYAVATILCVLSVVFGVVALVKRRPRVFPIAGLVISAVILVLNILMFLAVYPAFVTPAG